MSCGASAGSTANSLSNQPHITTKAAVTPSTSSSTVLNQQSDSNRIPKRGRRADTNEIIENFLLIWLDGKIDESSKDYQNSIKQLRRTVNTVEPFQDTEECIDYISKLQDKKAFLIISGALCQTVVPRLWTILHIFLFCDKRRKLNEFDRYYEYFGNIINTFFGILKWFDSIDGVLCQTVVPRIHNIDQIHSIYVFCHKKEKYEEWSKDWSKIKGIYTEITPICDSAQQSARQCDEDSVVITGISSLNQIEPSFMYTQLFKEIILEIDFDKKKEINNLAEYAREKYAGNDKHLQIINEFSEAYPCDSEKNNKPIWWYTRECFTYHLLNKALGTMQVETLLKMGVFIRDLHQNIERFHSEQTNDIHTLYPGKTMTKKDFYSKIQQGGLMSLNNFLSTSDDRIVALHFINEGLKSSKDKIGVLFKMTIDQSISSAP
ncbi:unnamed protein product, partial [Rotaria sp. Silwood1]